MKKMHRLTDDPARTACGKSTRYLLAVRYEPYMTEFMKRHDYVTPCKKCWPRYESTADAQSEKEI